MELRELVSGEVQTVEVEATVKVAAEKMNSTAVGALAALDGDDVIGIFTERDLVRVMADAKKPSSERVGDWMTPYPDILDADAAVKEAADWMLAAGYRHIPVVDGTGLVGMASIKDVLWALTEEQV